MGINCRLSGGLLLDEEVVPFGTPDLLAQYPVQAVIGSGGLVHSHLEESTHRLLVL